MTVKPFGLWPVVMMILLSVGLLNHVMVLPLLLQVAKRDAWIAILGALIIALPIVAFPLHRALVGMNGERLDQWLSKKSSPFFSGLVLTILNLMLLIVAFTTLVDVIGWTSSTYLPITPPIVVCAIFAALCLIGAISGLRTIALMACILLPIVVVLGDFVMSANMPDKDYRYLLPMLENGIKPLVQGATYSISSFMELTFLLMIQHHLRKTFKKWHLSLLVIVLMGLTLGPTIGALSEFGPVEAAAIRYPAYAQWRLVKIGNYFEHVDFFAVYQWLSGAFIRISMSLYLFCEYTPIRKLKRQWIGHSAIIVALVGVSYFMLNNMFLYINVIKIYFAFAWIVFLIILLMVWLLSYRRTGSIARGEERGKRHEEDSGLEG
ncbi:endospore germination permease [Paenibacillus sp. NPDC058071]|uniref:GerAB/ArcD/ProY family transporter n=1 Tax=Paenibacillus sp. NPDC058071 TaxID=3346326 RepID=UPI0036D7A31C